MIRDSWPWKKALLNDAEIIDRWAAKRSQTSRRSTLLERKIFLSAFAMRKLLESEKLSSTFESLSVACEVYPAKAGRKVNQIRNDDVFRYFDLDKVLTKTVNLEQLLHVIVHSLTFVEAHSDDLAVIGFFVTSKHRRRHVWYVRISDFTQMMREVGNDCVDWMHLREDAEKDYFTSARGVGEPPPEHQPTKSEGK